MELPPEEAYKLYKSRDSIEKAFHIFKNVLAVDTPHLDGTTLRGYVFTSFIGLLLYYRPLQVLSENDMVGETSVKDSFFPYQRSTPAASEERAVLRIFLGMQKRSKSFSIST